MNDPFRRYSGGAPAPSAPHASASGPDTPPEEAALNDSSLPAEQQPDPSAGRPESEAPKPQDAGPHPGGEHENHGAAKVEHDLEQLTTKAQKADEYLELAQRTKADFENFRKRAARETAAAQERGVAKLAKELLPAIDNLERAVAAVEADSGGGDLASGIKLVHDELIAALERAGIELFSPEGTRFDPEHHEAVAQQPVDGAEPGTVVEVYQRGCRLGDYVIRPARVLVAG